MKVSIIIPVYNAEKYLEECLESAINQSYSDIEIIAVDDGSTDNSPKILKKYSNKIKILTKKNGGVASAINSGIKEMTGEWFKLLGADDVLYPNAVEILIEETSNITNKKKCILASNYHIIDSKGRIVCEYNEPDYNQLDRFNFNVNLLDHFIGNAITSLIHKSTIDSFGMFDENFSITPDYELWLRYCILYKVRIHLIPKFLAKYRVHEEMLSQTIADEKIKVQNGKVSRYVLNKLDFEERQKYEIALKQLQRRSPLELSKACIKYLLMKFLPKSTATKIIFGYRRKFKIETYKIKKLNL